MLLAGLWRRRERFDRFLRRSPGKALAAPFGAGLGTGLLLASALSSFWWRWAIGGLVFAASLVAGVFVALRE